MSDQSMREILARLDAQEAELAALRAERTARQRRRLQVPGGRRTRLIAIITSALLVALVPLAIYAANPFTDLQGTVHDGNIDTIYNLGITTGCNPPDLDNYCPTDNVTRQEMASFLARTASLNRVAAVTRSSAADPGDNLGGASKEYMTVDLTVPGKAGGAQLYVRVLFTGYAFARSATVNTANPNCPCMLRGEITVDAEVAGGSPAVDAQVVTRTVIGANAAAIVNPGPAERLNFSGSRVFLLSPGVHTFRMTVTREAGTADNIGFGFGNMQAEVIAFGSTGTVTILPGASPSPSPSASPSPSPSTSPSPSPSASPSASPSPSPGPSASPGG